MGYIHVIKTPDNTTHLIEPTLYATATATTSNNVTVYTASFNTNFELVDGVCVQVKCPNSTNTAGATLNNKKIYYENSPIAAGALQAEHVYSFVYVASLDNNNGGWNLVGDIDTDTVYTHPTTDGNLHVPATGTTINDGKFLKAGSSAGSISWQALTKNDITDFPTEMTPSSHTHGNVQNDGTLSTASYAVVTDANKKITVEDLHVDDPNVVNNVTGTSFISNIATNEKGKITTLTKKNLPTASTSVAGITTVGASGGAAAYDHNHDSTYAAKSHTHGNIQNDGKLQTTDVAITDGDKLVITDATDSNKIARTSLTFDGTTATKALTQKGTWETFNNYSLPLAANGTRGGIQIGFTTNATNRNYAVQLDSEKAYVNVPWTDQNVTQSADTSNADIPILLKGTTGNATVGTVKYPNTTGKVVSVNPSTGKITAPGGLEGKATSAGTADAVAWTGVSNRPTKLTLTGDITGEVSLGAGDLSLATTVNHNHDDRYKIANGVITLGSNTITPVTSVNGHTGSTVSVTAGDLGLAAALRFVGKTTSNMSETFTEVPAGITSYTNPIVGDVVLDKNSDAEYVCIAKTTANNTTTYTWELLGRSGSWSLSDHVHGNITNDGKMAGSTASGDVTTFHKFLREDGTWVIPKYTTNTNTTYTIATGDNNGQIKVTPSSGNAYNVDVKGLDTAAYTPSTDYTYKHLTDYNFNSTRPLSKYVTFDKNQPAGAPKKEWYNGFVSSHNDYHASYIINGHSHRDEWYVGHNIWYENNTPQAQAPTWYLLAHSGNIVNNTINLSRNTETTIATIAGVAIKIKLPASDNTNTASAVDNILDGSNSGTAITYAPYSSQQSKLSFDTSSTAPSRTDRLNLNGYLYATKLYSGGTEVSVSGHNHNSSYLTAVGYDSTNKKIYYTKNGSNTDVVTFGSNAFNSTSYLPLDGGTMTGDIAFTSTGASGTTGTSKKITWSGSTDNASIYYTVPSADAGRLVINTGDDTNCLVAWAYKDSIKAYTNNSTPSFYPATTNTGSIGTSSVVWANMYATTFHGALEGNASTASAVAWSGITGAPGNVTRTTDGFMSKEDKIKLDDMEVIKGTQTGKTGSWTGTSSVITSLYDGLTIKYYLNRDPSGNASLNLTLADGTTTGAIPCYYNSGRLTTHYAVGSVITLTYFSAGSITINGAATTDNRWIADANYDSGNTNTATRQKVRTTDANYSLLFADPVIGTADNNTAYYTYRNDSIYVNPSTGNVYATTFNGALTGNVTGNVTGNISTTASNALTVNSGYTLYLNSASGTSIIFTKNGADTDHELARFDISGNFVPKSSSSYTIGTSSNKWSAIYATTLYGTVATSQLSGTISNSQLANSSMTVGNKSISLGGSGSVHDILYAGSINTAASWNVTDPGFYRVGSTSAFTGDGNPGNIYTYGHTIVTRASNYGMGQFYIPDGASATAGGIRYRSGWDGNYQAWATILDSANYTSYTVTKTGTGASGTWGISITGSSASCTGNANTATTASNLTNFKVTTTSNLGIDAPGINAIGYVSGLTKAYWNYNQSDGSLYTQFYNANWISEIFQDYRTGKLSVRGRNNGTWQPWKPILTGDDDFVCNPVTNMTYDPATKKFSKTAGSGGWNTQVYSSIGYKECRLTFKVGQTNAAIMIGLNSDPTTDANWTSLDYAWYLYNSGGLDMRESNSTKSSITGHTTYAANDEFIIEYSNGEVRYFHNGTLCRTVKRDYGTLLYMDSSFHGLGNVYGVIFEPIHEYTATRLMPNTSFDYNEQGVTWFDINGTAGQAVQVNDTPTTAWWHILRFNHNNTNGYYTDLAIPFNDSSLYYKIIRNGAVVGTKWYKVLDDGNYTSYTVKKDGTGASGTWGISVTGSSGSCTGNATTATTATNLSAAPTIASGGTATVTLSANTAYTLTVGGKSVVFKTPADANTNTLVNYTLGATTKAYLMACQSAPTSTTTARASHGDTLVYLTATSGQLSAKSYSVNDGAATPAEKVRMEWNSTDQSLDFIFS